MRLGFLYAGQGSQHPGMGADLYEAYPAFRAVFEEADVDFDLKAMCFSDPHGLLDQTRYTQPCMVAFAAGMTAVLKEEGITPVAAAGLSLGEYSALHAAGVFNAGTAISLAAYRGRVMEEAARGVESAMVAVLGLDRQQVEAACAGASHLGMAVICNCNCPGQIVIGGEKAAVEHAAALARSAGARRCLPLRVSGPFHTPFMAPAGAALKQRFSEMTLGEPRIDVIFNCLGDLKGETDSIAELLVRQVQSGVYMEDSLRKMAGLGVDALVEIGPGNALTGFARKTVPQLPVYTLETAEDVEKLRNALKKEDQP